MKGLLNYSIDEAGNFPVKLVLIAEDAEDLKIMIEYFYRVCLNKELGVNVAKSKVYDLSG